MYEEWGGAPSAVSFTGSRAFTRASYDHRNDATVKAGAFSHDLRR